MIIASCKICDEHLVGDAFKIGNNYYCRSHYEEEKDKPENNRKKLATKRIQNALSDDFGNLIDTDFTK